MIAWLEVAGSEVMHQHRTLTYLRRNLGCAGADVTLADPFIPEVGYSDIYSDTYDADPFDVRNLGCYCSALGVQVYEAPDTDPAPWYTATRPESADFLGYLIDSLTLSDVATRNTTSRTRGVVLGRQQLAGRTIEVSGIMWADDSLAAMAYGKAWLTRMLLTEDDCGTADIRILPACDEDAYRSLLGAALVDGPVYEQLGTIRESCMQRFTFTILAGNPFLQTADTDVIVEQILVAGVNVNDTITGVASGSTAAIVTLEAGAGSAVTSITIKATPTSGACPTGDTADTITYTIPTLAANTTLVIDAASRTIEQTNASGVVIGGLDLFTLTGPFAWLDVPAEETWCLDIEALVVNPTTSIHVASRDLEL